MESEFVENNIEKELRKGSQFPLEIRKANCRKYEYMYDTSFEAEISSQVFYDEILQEKLFCLLYMQNPDVADNFFEFEFPEENLEYGQGPQGSQKSVREKEKIAGRFSQGPEQENRILKDIESFSPENQEGKSGSKNIFHSDMRKTDSQKLESLVFNLGSSQKKNLLKEVEARNLDTQYGNYIENENIGTVGMGQGPRSGNKPRVFEEDSLTQEELISKNVLIHKNKFPSGFDGLDILILQRSLESIKHDDHSNPRNRRTKRYLPNEMGRIKETEMEAIKNYVNDFMSPYIRREKIFACMKNIPGFDAKDVRVGGVKHFS